MPRLAIIIPVLNDLRHLEDTLLSVLENRPADCEIVVVHNRPYTDPYNLNEEVTFIQAEHSAGLVDCLNLGLAYSSAPLVHFLACGIEVLPGWADAALEYFAHKNVAAVAGILVDRKDEETIVSAGWGYRREGLPWRLAIGSSPSKIAKYVADFCGPDILFAFYQRTVIDTLGGISATAGDVLAGIDMALGIQAAGLLTVLEPLCLGKTSNNIIYQESAFRHGWGAERLFWRWASSQGLFGSVSGHIAMLIGQFLLAFYRPRLFLELAGRILGAGSTIFTRCPKIPAQPVNADADLLIVTADFSQKAPLPSTKSLRRA